MYRKIRMFPLRPFDFIWRHQLTSLPVCRYNVGDGEVFRWDEKKREMVPWKKE